MAYGKKVALTVNTDGTQAGSAQSRKVTGRIDSIEYIKDDFANGVDIVVTLVSSGLVVWSQENVNASVIVRPRVPVQDTAGVDLTYDGTYKQVQQVRVCDEMIQVAVTSGGDTKSGVFKIWLE